MNEYANAITDNRWMAKAQLDADNMGTTTWKQYTQLCDNIAIASWDKLTGRKGDDDTLAKSLIGLFAFFGCDARPTVDMQNRFLLSCVTVKRMQSEAMRQARKNLRSAKNLLEEAQESIPLDEKAVEIYQNKVKEYEATVTRMESEPKNVWYDKIPMLSADYSHASKKCRKLIEDEMADVLAERGLMTIEEKLAERQRLDDERDGRNRRKKKEAQAKKQEESKAESNNAPESK
jgi:hypothetical protein